MATVVIAHTVNNSILLWTDAAPADQAYSRRNVVEVGLHAVALHDDVDAWLPIIRPVLGDRSLRTMPVDQLATHLGQQLQGRAPDTDAYIGVIVAGFLPNGSPCLLGLHSGRDFQTLRFGPSVIGGLPPSLFEYLRASLQTIPQTFDNVADRLLMAGDVYYEVVLAQYGLPRGAAVAVLKPGQTLAWLPDLDIENRLAHNRRRLHALQLGITRYLLENRS